MLQPPGFRTLLGIFLTQILCDPYSPLSHRGVDHYPQGAVCQVLGTGVLQVRTAPPLATSGFSLSPDPADHFLMFCMEARHACTHS